jgi:colicin import membrane protein
MIAVSRNDFCLDNFTSFKHAGLVDWSGSNNTISTKLRIMKKVFVLAALIGLSTAAFAQDTTQTKAEKAVSSTKKAGKKAGKEIKKDAKYVGDKTKEGAQKVGDGVEEGADKVGKGTKKAYKATKKEAKDLKNDVKEKVD